MIAFVLLIGLIVGWYAKEMYVMLKNLYEAKQEERAAKEVGVVRPSVSRVTKHSPIDLSTNTGGVRRPTPDELLTASMKDTNERLNRGL